ncbi:MAG: 50S ribosomal protein L25 [Planctomycetota bacterium]|nr:50S ribosomal protein L25 [Planctomycetota bacterium]
MAEYEKLVVQSREKIGSSESRRLRRTGVIPANLYGNKKETVTISVTKEGMDATLKSRKRVFEVELDGSVDMAMFREVQWDTYGNDILHVDLLRVDPTSRIEFDVPVDLRGVAPGTLEGGIIDQQMHAITLDCLAVEVPDAITIRIGGLHIGDVIHARDVKIPEGTKLASPEDAIVIQIVEPMVEEEEEVLEGPLEPEVIGRGAEEEDE